MSRDSIFSAAKEVFVSEGADGLSVRKVAARAGVSPMAMYRHFADKEALLNALMLEGFSAWEARVRAVKAKDPLRWLDELLEAFLAFSIEEPHYFDAAFFLPAPKARRYPDDFEAGRSPAVAMILARIEEGQALGRIARRAPLEIVIELSGLAQGLVSMQRAGRFSNEDDFRRLFRTSLRHALDSFRLTPMKR